MGERTMCGAAPVRARAGRAVPDRAQKALPDRCRTLTENDACPALPATCAAHCGKHRWRADLDLLDRS
jgi:hypothetical protein